MKIGTKAFGTVEINKEDIITFKNGLAGFEDKQSYVLLGNPEADELFLWLQSTEEQDLAFVVIQPRFFKPDYRPVINYAEIEELSAENEEDLLSYAIVRIPEDVSKMTANLRAPVIINVKNNKGKQVVLNDDKYEIKTPILAEK